jgi:hypothetical protein
MEGKPVDAKEFERLLVIKTKIDPDERYICLSEHLLYNFREFLSLPVGLVHGGRQLERGPVRRSLPPVCSHSSHAATCGNVHLSTPGRFCRYLRKMPLT